MFARVIVGWDGSPGAEDALALARALGHPDRASICIAVSYPADIRAGNSIPDLPAKARKELEGRMNFARAQARAGEEVRAVHGMSAGQALRSFAEEEEADLVVLGAPERGLAERLFPGDVAAPFLHSGPCAVAFAPKGFVDDKGHIASIGIGLDGSLDSTCALEAAKQIAERHHAQLVLATVGEMNLIEPSRRPAERQRLHAILDEGLRVLGHKAPATLRLGRPADQLAALGEAVDLLVIGSRGRGPLKRLLLGSVGSELLRNAPCPVLVTPRTIVAPAERHAAGVPVVNPA